VPNGAVKDQALHGLQTAQRAYTRAIEAHFRRLARAGGTRRPTSTVEVGMAVLTTLNRVAGTLDGILDVLRYSVGSVVPWS